MNSLQENMIEYKNNWRKGESKAYQGLTTYMMSLKNHFTNKYPDYSVPGKYLLLDIWI